MTKTGIETYVGVVHPWMCDAMGHLNVRHYMAMFDDASFQLLGRIADPRLSPMLGWADVRMEIDYAHETVAGTLVTVRTVVDKIGNSSLTYLHEMRGTLDDVLRARVVVVTVRFDLQSRSKISLEADARQSATKFLHVGGGTGGSGEQGAGMARSGIQTPVSTENTSGHSAS